MSDRWFFLVDECVDPDVAYRLDSDAIGAEPVTDALWPGARDFVDILPYAREHDRILVTSNVTDFGGLADEEHEGIVLIFDNEMEAELITAGLRMIVDRYQSRNELRGYEKLDPWVERRE